MESPGSWTNAPGASCPNCGQAGQLVVTDGRVINSKTGNEVLLPNGVFMWNAVRSLTGRDWLLVLLITLPTCGVGGGIYIAVVGSRRARDQIDPKHHVLMRAECTACGWSGMIDDRQP